MSVVEIKDVTKRYGDVVALQGIDLEITEGEFVSLIGPSGCGKSTLLRIIALPLEMARWDRKRRDARVREMLDLVELTGFANHHPWQLSGGMQQRVSIARALSFDPALLLMDEPFGALDEMTRERLNMELLQIWERSGSTIVFVTHSIAEAVFLSTRVVVMSPRPGRITEVVPIDLDQPRTAVTREQPRFFELVTQVRESLHLGVDVDRAAADQQPSEAAV
jgi:NitT/TauT family transport system ATP-binding protein